MHHHHHQVRIKVLAAQPSEQFPRSSHRRNASPDPQECVGVTHGRVSGTFSSHPHAHIFFFFFLLFSFLS